MPSCEFAIKPGEVGETNIDGLGVTSPSTLCQWEVKNGSYAPACFAPQAIIPIDERNCPVALFNTGHIDFKEADKRLALLLGQNP